MKRHSHCCHRILVSRDSGDISSHVGQSPPSDFHFVIGQMSGSPACSAANSSGAHPGSYVWLRVTTFTTVRGVSSCRPPHCLQGIGRAHPRSRASVPADAGTGCHYVLMTSIHCAGCPSGSLFRCNQLTALLLVHTMIFCPYK